MDRLQEWFDGKIRLGLLLLCLFSVCVCAVRLGTSVWNDWNTPPKQRVNEAVYAALTSTEYSYSSEAVRISETGEEVLTRLTGERNGDNVHLYGKAEALNTEIDLYQIGSSFYRRDIVNGDWMQMLGQELVATEYLIQEINPLGCLKISDNTQVIVKGKEKVNGIRCKKYHVQSSGETTFLTSEWSEFYYTMWIDKKNRLHQVEMIADDHEENTEQLCLKIRFDWDAKVGTIQAPV